MKLQYCVLVADLSRQIALGVQETRNLIEAREWEELTLPLGEMMKKKPAREEGKEKKSEIGKDKSDLIPPYRNQFDEVKCGLGFNGFPIACGYCLTHFRSRPCGKCENEINKANLSN